MNSMLSKEEVLEKETDGIFDAHESGITGIFNAMEIFAEQESRREAIEFCLHFVGELTFPKGITHYEEGSNEDIIIHLPSTIEKRFDNYLIHKQNKEQ